MIKKGVRTASRGIGESVSRIGVEGGGGTNEDAACPSFTLFRCASHGMDEPSCFLPLIALRRENSSLFLKTFVCCVGRNMYRKGVERLIGLVSLRSECARLAKVL